jgi:hypothetical protein
VLCCTCLFIGSIQNLYSLVCGMFGYAVCGGLLECMRLATPRRCSLFFFQQTSHHLCSPLHKLFLSSFFCPTFFKWGFSRISVQKQLFFFSFLSEYREWIFCCPCKNHLPVLMIRRGRRGAHRGRMQQKISLRGAGGGGGGLSKNSSTQNNGELLYLVVS